MRNATKPGKRVQRGVHGCQACGGSGTIPVTKTVQGRSFLGDEDCSCVKTGHAVKTVQPEGQESLPW